MNEIARVTVENHLYIKREEAWKARDGAIKNGRNKEYIQMWDDIGNLYDELLKQVENMKSIKE